jgi:hypothetical protein
MQFTPTGDPPAPKIVYQAAMQRVGLALEMHRLIDALFDQDAHALIALIGDCGRAGWRDLHPAVRALFPHDRISDL